MIKQKSYQPLFKKLTFLSVYLFFTFFFLSQAFSLSEDLINHHYIIEEIPSQGDRLDLYFGADKSLVIMPAITNKEYTHICWAKWSIDTNQNTLKIKNAKNCQILNGNFNIEKKGADLSLSEEKKKLYLRSINN